MLRSALFRALTVVFTFLQLAAPPLAAAADARAISEAARAGPGLVHVEEHSSSNCVRVHPADCALCQVAAGLLATPAKGPYLGPPTPLVVVAPRGYFANAVAAAHHPLARPRAPPAV